MGQVMALYDVRGIQDYIFKTSKLKDAIGASAIVENIIEEALQDAVEKEGISDAMLMWKEEDGTPKTYVENEKAVQVLYIGGGNALVQFRDDKLCVEINKRMSRYVLDHTYGLQLAVAYIEKTGNYREDYRKVNEKMKSVKSHMAATKPVGALPVMEVEYSTGNPAVFCTEKGKDRISTETQLKKAAEEIVRKKVTSNEKLFESYVDEKGVDSTLAVVHIDGNNMGLRIRKLVENITDYADAVNAMRHISCNINRSYKDVFTEMEETFNGNGKNNKYYILKVLTAGDDITYVCTGRVAIASVQYYAERITKKYMTDEDNPEFRFSVCAGIAFYQSHFPFSVAYEVAENCCESAKVRAKKSAKNGAVGNYFDFQICKNLQAKDIERIREAEYRTPSGENLVLRPYDIFGKGIYSFQNLRELLLKYAGLKDNKGTAEKMTRAHAKTLRNTYPLGRSSVEEYNSFLQSRNVTVGELYVQEDKQVYARLYDALELMDDYVDLNDILVGKENRNA